MELQIVFKANATGAKTAAQLAATMQAATLDTGVLTLLGGGEAGTNIASQVGSSSGSVATLTVDINVGANYQAFFPNNVLNPIQDLWTSQLRVALGGQPVLAALPTKLS